MAFERLVRRYRYWYAKLLRLYPKPYYERYSEGMEQTFSDLLRERAEEDRGLFGCALWMFVETSAGIVREKGRFMVIHNKNIIHLVLGTGLILLIPLVAMQVTEEVNWSLFDFAFMGALLFGTGLLYELVARKADTAAYRVAVGVVLAAVFLLVWVNAAVGIIGEPGGPNLMYVGVLGVGLIGALIARFRPHGMARALFMMAIAQGLVPVIALMTAMPDMMEPPGVVGVFGLNAFFALLFVGSAMLFRRASASAPT